ncbi:MAG TPA: hypothetical protein VHX61_18840 [Rhizomicrobium sp.]|jgi:hypothetical protein|nr:hypothetical protein [Rhizomicrobium sp.]
MAGLRRGNGIVFNPGELWAYLDHHGGRLASSRGFARRIRIGRGPGLGSDERRAFSPIFLTLLGKS